MKLIRSKSAITLVYIVVCLFGSQALADKKGGKEKHQSLPPGLQKKVDRGQPLPPGWQKKLSRGDILDESLYVRGAIVIPLNREGILSLNIEGTILRLHDKTRKILEILP